MSFIKVAAHSDSVVERGYLDHPQNTGEVKSSTWLLNDPLKTLSALPGDTLKTA